MWADEDLERALRIPLHKITISMYETHIEVEVDDVHGFTESKLNSMWNALRKRLRTMIKIEQRKHRNLKRAA